MLTLDKVNQLQENIPRSHTLLHTQPAQDANP